MRSNFGLPKLVQPTSSNKIARHQYYSCGRKRPYPTLEDANTRMVAINDDPHREHTVHVYTCLYCPAYHVGRVRTRNRIEHMRDFLSVEFEVGDRVWGCMFIENRGTRAKRRHAIAQRYNSRERKLLRR